jgi:hypothetical protein
LIIRRYREYVSAFHPLGPETESVEPPTDTQQIEQIIAADPDRRHKLVESVLALARNAREVYCLATGKLPLVTPADLEWLVEKASADEPQAEKWAALAASVVTLSNPEHLAIWLRAREQSPAVATAISFPMLITIDSEEAREAKKLHDDMQKRMRRPGMPRLRSGTARS